MRYLFIFTIGPVQPFIEGSRKIKDMYAGSRFLSEIMNEAVKWVTEKCPAEVIFPVDTTTGDGANIPNRLIARFMDIEEQRLADSANSLETHIRQYFRNRCMEILRQAGIGEAGLRMAENQIRDFLELYWLYVEYEPGSSYSDAYQRLFKGIQEVKGVRMFRQTEEPDGRKCAKFPEYNAIFVKRNKSGNIPYLVNKEYMYDITDIPSMRHQVKTKEPLCAIALVKRIYDRSKVDWYSARLMLLLSRVEESVFRELKIPPTDEVANVLYDMVNECLEEEDYETCDIQAAGILKKYIEEKHIDLCLYYALIKFDGDDMGKKFIGLKTEEEQRDLSKGIGEFAKRAPQVMKRFGGLPGYAGGEDFFGFVPADRMLPCLLDLRREFEGTPQLSGLTFSAGIAVTHLMQPLKHMIAMADEMERAAKNAEGKNAFAIGIIKRSGETVSLPPYKMKGAGGEPEIRDLIHLTEVLKRSGCSRSLIFNISHIFESFTGEADMLKPDMARALIMDCIAGAKLDVADISNEELADSLMTFYTSGHGLQGFLETLNGLAFLTREVIGCCIQ